MQLQRRDKVVGPTGAGAGVRLPPFGDCHRRALVKILGVIGLVERKRPNLRRPRGGVKVGAREQGLVVSGQ